MQLYALDDQKKAIIAEKAAKQQDYFCIECMGVVHLRKGMHRRPHFYHLSPNCHCSQSGKSMVHLQTQWHLYKLLPEGDCFLEYRFPEIQRIADLIWVPKKIIFEIQCSPISAKEVEARNQDYAKMGYQVIWILHNRCFNHWRVSSAELFLRNSPVYFTNMNNEGVGTIYDQLDLIDKGVRKILIHSLAINPSQICSLEAVVSSPQDFSLAIYPRSIQKKISLWPFHFAGDLISISLSATKDSTIYSLIEKAALIESNQEKTFQSKKNFWGYLLNLTKDMILRLYCNLFQIILEKSTH